MDLMFSWCLLPDVHEPKNYLAAVVGIFAEYPQEVRAALADPIQGSRLISDRPSLAQLRHVLEDLAQPYYRREERNSRKSLPEPEIDRSNRPTYEELQARCAKDGLLIGKKYQGSLDPIREADKLKRELGITEQQWAQLPDRK